MDAQSLKCRNGDDYRKFKKLAFAFAKGGKLKICRVGLEARDPRKGQLAN